MELKKIEINKGFDFASIPFTFPEIRETHKKPKECKKVEFDNETVVTFDIETTSEPITDGEPIAYMYIWQMCVNGVCFYGRTWLTFHLLIDWIVDYYNVSPNHILTIYVHNLAYEFQFIKKRFQWVEIDYDDRSRFKYTLVLEDRSPVKITTTTGLQFRCSYQLTAYSMANVIKYELGLTDEYKGDLDYTLIRNSITPLTEAELNYCLKDTYYLYLLVKKYLTEYGNYKKIPNTSTGVVRNIFKAKLINDTHYKYLMQSLVLQDFEYHLAKKCFMGGFTHSSALNVNKVHHNVSSYDFTSSYPAVMLIEDFPMSSPRNVKIQSLQQFDELKQNLCIFGLLKIKGLKAKYHEHYISESKCIIKTNTVVINGRIAYADEVVLYATDVDIEIIRASYEIDDIVFHKDYTLATTKGKLPDKFRQVLIKLIDEKNRLKAEVKKDESLQPKYMKSKQRVNACYGMSVMAIDRPQYNIDVDGDICNEVNENAIIENNNSSARFTYYLWGIYITAYARRNMWSGICEFGNDYIYGDTDSLKVLNYENHTEYINRYNSEVRSRVEAEKQKLNPLAYLGNLGEWDFEGTYDTFKTLGAKRYIYTENGKLHLTCAGLNKTKGAEYLSKFENPFSKFEDGLVVPASNSGRQIAHYVDESTIGMSVDYLGNVAEFNEKSSLHLSESEYHLSTGDLLKQIIQYKMKRGL